jgi:peptidoglycan/xylan/chitin deacetylase (PgdA/CDA1 family)
MPISIKASVGENGKNQKGDVKLVISLFNEINIKKLKMSDQCSLELIQAIKDFQKPIRKIPDGRIDPNGTTWKKLVVATGRLGEGVALVLSFDDGPAPVKALKAILATLQAGGVRAEFYVLGTEVEKYPDAAKAIVTGGHKIQNHSYSHPNLAKANEKVVRSELEKTQESIKKATGATATKVRPPYGAGGWSPRYDPELSKVAGSLSLKIETWDIDTRDWMAPKGIGQNKLTMIEKQFWANQEKTTLNVLMHVQDETARDLAYFISQLKKWGFAFANP